MAPTAGGKPLRLVVSTHDAQDREDREYWRNRSPEERLDAVELLRIQSGRPCIRGMRIRVVDITAALLFASRRLDHPVIAA